MKAVPPAARGRRRAFESESSTGVVGNSCLSLTTAAWPSDGCSPPVDRAAATAAARRRWARGAAEFSPGPELSDPSCFRRAPRAPRQRWRPAGDRRHLRALSAGALWLLPWPAWRTSGRPGRASEHDGQSPAISARRGAGDCAEALALPDRAQRVDRIAKRQASDPSFGRPSPRRPVERHGASGAARATPVAAERSGRPARAPANRARDARAERP